MIRGINRLGLEALLYFHREDQEQNLVFSPSSASIALGMAMSGASTDSRRKIEKIFGMGPDAVDAEVFRDLRLSIENIEGGRSVCANSVWVSPRLQLPRAFVQEMVSDFGAPVTQVDFDTEAAQERIDAWVHKATHGWITRLPLSLDATTYAVLVNATTFFGTWEKPFRKDDTAPAIFHSPGGDVSVPMMSSTEEFYATSTAKFSAVDLPYQDKVIMRVFLPSLDSNVTELLSLIATRGWEELSRNDTQTSLVRLPKWSVRSQSALRAFLAERVPILLSSTTEPNAALGHPYEIVQETFLEVDEEGTRAGAVTAEPYKSDDSPELVFVADRPFVYAVLDRMTGAILFAGVVIRP